MNEFARIITPEEFKAGLELRLAIGQIAVGEMCKIRMESPHYYNAQKPVQYTEATVSILEKQNVQNGTMIKYGFVATKNHPGTRDFVKSDLFNADSLAINRHRGTDYRLYLYDDVDPRWDESLQELADLESSRLISIPLPSL
jgi:hypothetical protein